MKKRKFLKRILLGSIILPAIGWETPDRMIPSASGMIPLRKLGKCLIHEHIMVDFIGAGETGRHRYDQADVIRRMLPYLQDLKRTGCQTLVDCTPAYLGRDVQILSELSKKSGLHIITNTGFYGARKGVFLPDWVWDAPVDLIAANWIKEYRDGIEGTNIFPGFIKIGVDAGPLTVVNRKLVEAAVQTAKQTGLSISSHTGDGIAAKQQVEMLLAMDLNPNRFRWVHAQNEKDKSIHLELANKGIWVELDGIRAETAEEHMDFLLNLRNNGMIDRILISQDSGWYKIGEKDGGEINEYSWLMREFIPLLKSAGLSGREVRQLLVINPAESLKLSA